MIIECSTEKNSLRGRERRNKRKKIKEKRKEKRKRGIDSAAAKRKRTKMRQTSPENGLREEKPTALKLPVGAFGRGPLGRFY